MAFLKWIGVAAALIVAAGAGFWAYMGGFASVAVARDSVGPVTVAYTTYRGPYQGLSDAWTRFQSEWEAAGAGDCDSLAIYLDPPDTPPEALRSVLACRTDTASANDAAALQAAFASFTIPQSNALRAEFPFKNFFSYMIGPMKVYPAMQDEMDSDDFEPTVAIEFYGSTSAHMDKIRFAIPTNADADAYQPLRDAF